MRERITKAITQLDQAIQQNASASEEMASMSEALSSQSGVLRETGITLAGGNGKPASDREDPDFEEF